MTSKPKHDTATAVDDLLAVTPQPSAPGADFPKEFEKTFWENFDRRFTIILVATLLVNFAGIAYLVMNPPPQMSYAELARIQKQFARLVLDKAPVEPETQFVESTRLKELPPETRSGSRVSRSTPSAGSSSANVSSPAGTRAAKGAGDFGAVGSIGRRTREQITAEVSRAGILGLLTSNSGLASGEAAEDVLSGSSAPATNLDEALAKISGSGLKRGSAAETGKALGSGDGGGREVRGSRETSAGGIDALVQGLGEGKAKGVQRSGELEVGNEEPLIETEEGKTAGSRDQDAVAAVVAKHTSAIQYCYQRELKRSPNLKGKLVVRFVITPQGTVATVTIISSTLNNAIVENCIVERIKRWDDFGAIDPAKGNTTIRQVYTFGY